MGTLTFDPEKHSYRLDGKRLTSVTTILNGGIPKPQLVNWAARVTASWVLSPDNGDELNELREQHAAVAPYLGEREYSTAQKFLSSRHDAERDTAAVRGTAVHSLAEQLVHGEEVEVPEELEPYIDGYLEFLDKWRILAVLTEKTVLIKSLGVAGRFDLIATSPYLNDGKPVMIDLKTSRGIYGETGLQCAAYSSADYYVDEHDPATELELPEIAATYVAHVTPSGTELHALATDQAQISRQFDMFKAAHFIYRTTTERNKIVGPALEHPTNIQTAA